MNKINPKEVAERYNSLTTVIDDDDKWHLRTKKVISEFIHTSINQIPNSSSFKILNAGSAGYSYGLKEENILHVDIADRHISHLPNSLIANIEDLPINDKEFDLIICVGSVLNYCDPILVLNQFSRVLKDKSYLILEFESSFTFELLFKKGFNQDAVFIETFFDAHGDKESIWYFSEKFIKQLLSNYRYKIISQERFHVLSPLMYRITKNASFANTFSKFDKILSFVPLINKFCSNTILLFRKTD